MGLAVALLAATLAAPDAKVELGRRLFFDRTISRTGRVSCSSCHDPEHGFSDRRPYSEDEGGETLRHSMSIVDAADGRPLHWDGEFGSVRELLAARFASGFEALHLFREIRKRRFAEEQAAGRKPDGDSLRDCSCYGEATGPDRAASYKPGFRPSPVPILFRLGEDDRYGPAFREAFGSPEITTDRIVEALDAYASSLRSGPNACDRYLAGNRSALTDWQRRGLALFTGKAGCAACHLATPEGGNRPRLTDAGFHNTGVAFAPAAPTGDEVPTLRSILLGGVWAGRGDVSCVKEDLGRFKTPSLRDVARRGPYMHDGSLSTLEEVVRYYDRGGIPNPTLDERLRPLGLTDAEVGDLVAFLRALTSDERPGIGPLTERRKMRLRVLGLDGKPLTGLRVEIRPAGDRLLGGRLDDPPQSAVTDSDGWIAFRFPKWTHVQVVSSTHEIHYDWLIPDCAPPMDVMAAPRDTVALKLRVEGLCTPDVIARWAGSDKVVARFRRVRSLSKGAAIYVADRRRAPQPWVSAVLSRGTLSSAARGWPRELDLSGGWTDPIDERPEPKK